MTELRERVARQWAAQQGFDWNGLTEAGRRTYYVKAQAALDAIAAAGFAIAPKESTYDIERAMAESVAVDDEGAFPPLTDLLGFSGENKAVTVIRAAYRAAMLAAQKGGA